MFVSFSTSFSLFLLCLEGERIDLIMLTRILEGLNVHKLQLYSTSYFIMQKNTNLGPSYLNFLSISFRENLDLSRGGIRNLWGEKFHENDRNSCRQQIDQNFWKSLRWILQKSITENSPAFDKWPCEVPVKLDRNPPSTLLLSLSLFVSPASLLFAYNINSHSLFIATSAKRNT